MFVFVMATYFYWPFGNNKVDASLLRSSDRTIVSSGEKIYQKSCASCHGVKLEGQPNWRNRLDNGRLPAPPHDETGHTWHHSDRLLFKITKLGSAALAGSNYETDMRGFKDELSDEEIIAVLSYIKSTWPEKIRRRQDMINEQSRQR